MESKPFISGSVVVRGGVRGVRVWNSVGREYVWMSEGELDFWNDQSNCGGRVPPGVGDALRMLKVYNKLFPGATVSSGLSQLNRPVDASGGPVLGPSQRVHCALCGFMVNPVGHSDRCRISNQLSQGESSRIRRMAWLGDAQHVVDVRMALLCSVESDVDLDRSMQSYVSNAAQAAYYRSSPGYELPVSDSEKSLATAFEASYYGDYRLDYLRRTFSVSAADLPDRYGYLAPYLSYSPVVDLCPRVSVPDFSH